MQLKSNTLISEIEKVYGIKLEIKKDKTLGNHLRSMGYPNLAKLLKVIES